MILNPSASTRIALFILTVICFQTASHAQTLSTVQNGSAQWVGNDGLAPWATNKGDDCYQITPGQPGQSGAVWYNHPIDFSNSFTISYQAFFGVGFIDGADGMALVFKRDNSNVLGSTGEGIGYGGISPSMIFEFDTYWNSGKGDPLAEPNEDHVAFNWMGNPNHNATASALGGPASNFYRSVPNLEDNSFHEVKVVWESGPNLLKLYLDCELQLSIQGDFKQVAFGGDSSVYFGFVGSTGNQFNAQLVCFNSISFVEGLDIPDTTICEGATVTSINALTPSGTSYSWSPTTGVSNPNISNPTFTPTTTTTYTVSISDVCGDVTTEDVTINVVSSALPTFAAVDAICNGDVLAPLPTTSLEGFPGTWSPALNNTITTTYTFTPTQCSNPPTGSRLVDLTIVVNQQVNPLFTAVADICNGAVLAPLPTTSNNGITGAWSPALDNTLTTIYTFTPDAGQCADTATLTITVNQKTEPVFTAVADICNGDILNPLPTTSNDGFTGTWTPVLDNTLTTVYTFTPDAGECADPTTLTINVNQKVDPDFNIVNDVCNGAILAPLPTLSNNGFNGTWSPALDTTTTTTYTFTPDLGECANPVTSTITVNPIVDPTFDPVDDICDGSVLAPLPTISNEGVNGTWSPALDATATTTYTFTPDVGECANPTTLTITYVEKINSFFTPVNDICNGDALTPLPTTSNNGVIGTWTPALDATATTTYTFTPDVGECAFPTTLTIVVNQKVNPDFTPVNDICDGDLLLPLPITSNDGITGSWSPTIDNTITTTYTFTPNTWECANPITLTITVEQKTDPVFTAVDDICNGDVLAALPITSNNGVTGTWSPALDNTLTTFYTFTPTAGLCANPATLTIVVEQKVDPVFTAVNDICDGDILVPLPTTSNDGINGTWAPALDNTLTTLYTFTPDAGECANPATLTISVNQKVDPVFTPINDICNGEPLAPLPQTSNNGITGTWNQVPGSTATTTYTFTPDEGECANPTTLTIVVNQKVDPDFTPVNDICDGDLIMPLPITSNDGITGSWSPALDNTLTTTYTFTPELWECANPATLTITVEQKTNPDFTPVDDICNGDVLAPLPTTSNNGITGVWAPALDNTTTSVYTFTPDAGLCANPATLTIAVIQKVDPIFTPVDGICENDVLAPLPTTSNDGITGTWTPALDNTITTLYTFTPDVGECANTATLTILVEQRLNSVFTPVDAICNGEALTTLPTTSNNGITGTWSPILNNRLTTTYTFTPNWWECAHTEILTIEVNQKVDPDFTPVDDICDGDFLTALPTTSNEGITGNWSPILDNTQTTTYRFAPNPWECAIPTTLTIVVAQKADPVFTPVNDICDGDLLTPLPTVSNDGFSGIWSPAMDNTTTTLYTFMPDIGECANPTTLTIVVIPNSISTFTQIDPICDGDTVVLPTVTNEGFRGSWTPAFNNNATTTYTFTADPGECAEPTTMTVVVNPINVLTISAINQSEDFDANQMISVSVTGGSGSYEYQLDGGDWQLSSVFEYVIGCQEHTFKVRDVIDVCNTQPEATLTILEFPKFFTPNGDGYNDTWNIKCLRDDASASVTIFDRLGKLLFQFSPNRSAWNGTFNGSMLPGTDYWFVVTYLKSDGVQTQFRSHFSLRH